MKTKVLTIISRMNVGGPAVLIADLASNLPEEFISHTLLTGHCESNEVDYLDNHPIAGEVIYIEKLSRSVFLVNEIRAFVELARIIWRLKPDVIHTHMSKAGVLGRIAGRLMAPKARIIHTFHGHLLYGYFSKPVTKVVVLLERFLARISDDLVAITNEVMNDLQKARIGRKSQWKVIRLGVAIPEPASKKTAKRALGVDDSDFVILWLGRFAEVKNPMLALDSFRIFSEKITGKVKLIMAGGGDLLDECKDYAAAHKLNVSFPGWIDEKYSYISASDLLILTSKNEGMGMVVLEAATQQVPTISTRVGGVSEFITDGYSGYFSDLSAEGFAGKLLDVHADKSGREIVGKNAENLVKSEFSSELFVKRHLELYQSPSKPA